MDGESLLELASFHRVAPLLALALWEQPDFGSLTQYVSSISNRSLLLTGELARLLKRLDAQAIPAIPFKGPALAMQLYGDPALRHFDDLDVLVRSGNFDAAKQVVLAVGYLPRERHICHESFTLFKGQVEIVLELHWNIVSEDFHLNLAPEEVWARRQPFSLGGASTSTLAPEDLLFFLCLHGSRHLCARLLWICDVAQLLRRNPALDWAALLERARVAGGRRMLFLGLYLANDLLAAPLPAAVAEAVRTIHTSPSSCSASKRSSSRGRWRSSSRGKKPRSRSS